MDLDERALDRPRLGREKSAGKLRAISTVEHHILVAQAWLARVLDQRL
jgi:hypothetical protein